MYKLRPPSFEVGHHMVETREQSLQDRERSRITTSMSKPSGSIVPLSPLTHVVIFSAILAPIAILPYIAVRRHLLSLHREVAEIGKATAASQRDLKNGLLEASVRREEFDKLEFVLTGVRRDLEKLRGDGDRKDLVRAQQEEGIRRAIIELETEQARNRYVHANVTISLRN